MGPPWRARIRFQRRGAVGEERVVGLGVGHEPGVLGQLVLELAGPPPGVAGVEADGVEGGRHVGRGRARGRRDRGRRRTGTKPSSRSGLVGPGQAPPALLLDRATDVEQPGVGGHRRPSPAGPPPPPRRSGGSARARARRRRVLDHQHHRPVEVRVAEHGLGHQQAARRARSRPESRASRRPRTVAAMLPDGTYDVFVVDAEAGEPAGALLLELTILAGDHKGEVVSMRADGLGVDELGALGTPGTLTVEAGEPSPRPGVVGRAQRPPTEATMQRLTGLDASFLYLETPSSHMHVAGLMILDPSSAEGGVTLEDVKAVYGAAPAPRPAVPPPPRGGALRPPPPAVDRGPRLRPRLPHPRHRPAVARHARAAARRSSAACRPSPSTAPGRCGRCG